MPENALNVQVTVEADGDVDLFLIDPNSLQCVLGPSFVCLSQGGNIVYNGDEISYTGDDTEPPIVESFSSPGLSFVGGIQVQSRTNTPTKGFVTSTWEGVYPCGFTGSKLSFF